MERNEAIKYLQGLDHIKKPLEGLLIESCMERPDIFEKVYCQMVSEIGVVHAKNSKLIDKDVFNFIFNFNNLCTDNTEKHLDELFLHRNEAIKYLKAAKHIRYIEEDTIEAYVKSPELFKKYYNQRVSEIGVVYGVTEDYMAEHVTRLVMKDLNHKDD
jgi:hypothetical protein